MGRPFHSRLSSMLQIALFLLLVVCHLPIGAVHGAEQQVGGQYLDEIVEEWSHSTAATNTVSNGGVVEAGNGAFLSPTGDRLVVVRRDGTLQAYHPATGATQWTYAPVAAELGAGEDDTVECLGGVFFSHQASTPYIAYAVVTGGTR